VNGSSNQTQALAYLDRVRKLYPHGVSSSSIVRAADAAVSVSHATASALLIVCGEARSEHDALLGAICSKGLQLASNEYSVHYLEDASVSEATVADVIKQHSPMVAIVFGAKGRLGAVSPSDPTRVLFAEALEKIANDLAIKKGFWRQLQESVVPLLQAR
jgi:hypothetical protein